MLHVAVTILDKDESNPDMDPTGTRVSIVPIEHAFIVNAGMESGAPSVALKVRLPDGSVVYAETSGKIFNMIAGALRGACQRWGVEV